MAHGTKKSRQTGNFTLPAGTEVYGELKLAGLKTSLHLHSKQRFPTNDIRDHHVTGVLHDLTKVSLIDCLAPTEPAFVEQGTDVYYYADVFPHFVILGDDHLDPRKRVISAVEFLIDDASVLFTDFDAFGWLFDARPHIEQIANANNIGRHIMTGSNPQIFYFTGIEEIFKSSTSLGEVSAKRVPAFNPFTVEGRILESRITISIAFAEEIDFREAISRTSRVIEYLGMIVGRPQALLGLGVQIGRDPEKPPLRVHWSMPPRRDPEIEWPKPGSFDILLNAVLEPEEFSSVLANWLERQTEWQDARFRFFTSFAKQRMHDIDRLVGAANMFDILPDSAFPAVVPIPEDLACARTAARKLFLDLPQSTERDGVLGALGRVGKSSLKHKARHRADKITEVAGEWFPQLTTVTDEAVRCRNFYVHGSERRFDYENNAAAISFFIDTLEFVFGASDLIESGWNIRSWIQHGTTATHPFGWYRASYLLALPKLKALLAQPS